LRQKLNHSEVLDRRLKAEARNVEARQGHSGHKMRAVAFKDNL
jgi:hypothetical protein